MPVQDCYYVTSGPAFTPPYRIANECTRLRNMADTLRASQYYRRWSKVRFPSGRAYLVASLSLMIGSLVIEYGESELTSNGFDVGDAFQMGILFAGSASAFIFMTRIAAKAASWVIARQAESLLRRGRADLAASHLLKRHRDMHPTVVHTETLRCLLVECGILPHSDFSEADASRASKELSNQSSRAIRWVWITVGLIVVLGLVRFVSMLM